MPFQSKKQMRYLFSQEPDVAKRWAKKTDVKNLPERFKAISNERFRIGITQ